MSLPDYTVNDPKGWCGDPTRGAALGRVRVHDKPRDFSGTIYLRRVYLDSGGYDSNGTYFGACSPRETHDWALYWYATEDHEIDGMLRAYNREAARTKVLQFYPNAKVRR